MKQISNIQEALQMIDCHDWYWMMADYGYEQNYNSAKAHMKAFVKLISTIDNPSIREMLRNLWILRFESSRNAINGKKDEENEAKQAELKSFLALTA